MILSAPFRSRRNALLLATFVVTLNGAAEPEKSPQPGLSPTPTAAASETPVTDTPVTGTVAARPAEPRHWGWSPLRPPVLPSASPVDRFRSWCRTPLDYFVLAKLNAARILPAPRAEPAQLIRRLYLDLLGLPPSPEAVQSFCADDRPNAYELLVEELLASPHFGERWGKRWLDQASYADTDGYDLDQPRPHAWRYRQWVLDALNADLPFDQFTVQQLAGDLLPHATPDQRSATGFLRNGVVNTEFGADENEDRCKRTFDRTEQFSTVWLGLTATCCRCHDHKYDPLTQREYYGLFSFFNNLRETQTPAPLPIQIESHAERKEKYDQLIGPLRDKMVSLERDVLPGRLAAWETRQEPPVPAAWSVLDATLLDSRQGESLRKLDDGSILVEGPTANETTYYVHAVSSLPEITAVRLEVLPDDRLPFRGPGRSPKGDFDLNGFYADYSPLVPPVASPVASPVAEPGQSGSPPSAPPAGVRPTPKKGARPLPIQFRYAIDSFHEAGRPARNAVGEYQPELGWSVTPRMGERHTAIFELAEPIRVAGGVKLRFSLYCGMRSPFEVLGRFRISVTGTRTPFRTEEVADSPGNVLAQSPETRSTDQARVLFDYFQMFDEEWTSLVRQCRQFDKAAPIDPLRTLARVVEEDSAERATRVLYRGDFLSPGESVEPHTPSILPPLEVSGRRPTRLDLAQWVTSPEHPLTARVAVNRLWQVYFGRGLVRTDDDFGTHGEPPSHPELLDWLAGELHRQAWSLKEIHRVIVCSATYQQSSRRRPELEELDPYNELLARQTRLRLDAELIRDAALSASDLLNRRIGGPSIVLPQPSGRDDLSFSRSSKLRPTTGFERYRRGMYVWLQRTAPPPLLSTFDGPNVNVSCTNRGRSTTPGQALFCLNEAEHLRCAAFLGLRVLREVPRPASFEERPVLDDRLQRLFAYALSRPATPEELQVLRGVHDRQRAFFEADPRVATQVIATYVTPNDMVAEPLPAIAAWMQVARVVLNLDEFLVRE